MNGHAAVPGSLDVVWIHGSANCAANTDPPLQVHRYNADTFILRQNKCLNFEAPFLYLLFGSQRAFLLDTGATASPTLFPVRTVVQGILQGWLTEHGQTSLPLVVAHSHSHGDHAAGDAQFANQPGVTLVALGRAAVQSFFGISQWPTQIVPFELGGRRLQIIPIPGHEASHIAVYDPQTEILLTGDTLYPGRLIVRSWEVYPRSIRRLVRFSEDHPITHILGNHIEMTNRPGIDFPAQATFHPDEHRLQLAPVHLQELHTALQTIGNQPRREVHDDFIIEPL